MAAIIYLDQNIWIELARAVHGKKQDTALLQALDTIRAASARGRVVFPLSAMHYMETWKSGSYRSRERLGTTMFELSGGMTVASYRTVLLHELRSSLSQLFPSVPPSTLTYLGRGVAHAFGMEIRTFRLAEPLRSQLPQVMVDGIEAAYQVHQEKTCLTGTSPLLPDMGRFGPTVHGARFRDHLNELATNLSSVPEADREAALYGISLGDILDPLAAVLAESNLTLNDLLSLGVEQVKAFVDSLPSRRADLHLHKQLVKNPSLKARLSDLEDWAGLGPATAYCDLVVCEKHFADLVRRDSFQTRAAILTDVRALPDWLVQHAAT